MIKQQINSCIQIYDCENMFNEILQANFEFFVHADNKVSMR